jgi:uncharacterized protein YprB with RNaseH-like and TPR domain
MLEHTFVHIQGLGTKTEQKLWQCGIRTWNDFLRHEGTVLSSGRDEFIKQELESSIEHREDIRFFRDRLTSGHMWRLFNAFEEKAVYLDIETSGGYQGVEEVTVIGIYDGRKVQTFVNGINLDEFEIAISEYDLIITFNGTSFDLPIIRRWFRNISLPTAHIDLRFLLKRLGYTGGLKKIEKALGLMRSPEINGMDGYEAVLLWKAYQWGDRSALDTLIQYNTADIVNLRPLMEMGYKEMKRLVFLSCF